MIKDNVALGLEMIMRILIADDSTIIRNSLRKLISAMNGRDEVIDAVNLSDTTNKIKEVKPDILILDLMMPGGSGFEAMNTVRELDYKITVIVLTNFATDLNRKRSEEEKVDYFLDKSNEFLKVLDICHKYRMRS